MSDLSDKVMTVLGALGMGGILTYLGTRYAARKGAEPGLAIANIEGRKTTLEEVAFIVARHETELKRLEEELEEARSTLRGYRSLLRLSLQHIGLLRRDMRNASIEPPNLPEQLSSESLPWDLNMYD